MPKIEQGRANVRKDPKVVAPIPGLMNALLLHGQYTGKIADYEEADQLAKTVTALAPSSPEFVEKASGEASTSVESVAATLQDLKSGLCRHRLAGRHDAVPSEHFGARLRQPAGGALTAQCVKRSLRRHRVLVRSAWCSARVCGRYFNVA